MQPCINRSDGNIIFTKASIKKKKRQIKKMRHNTVTFRLVTMNLFGGKHDIYLMQIEDIQNSHPEIKHCFKLNAEN